MTDEQITDQLVKLLEAAQLSETCCDKPEDRMWHAADNTWWRRVENQWVSADAPSLPQTLNRRATNPESNR